MMMGGVEVASCEVRESGGREGEGESGEPVGI